MACHVFTHKISDCINVYHITFLQCGQIKPHWSSLKNVENSKNNFCQSIQICCREKYFSKAHGMSCFYTRNFRLD